MPGTHMQRFFAEESGMYCLKCGKETRENQVFCEECLKDMEKCPVKPGTAIQLPQRTGKPQAKRPGHKPRSLPPEEEVARLRKLVRRLTAALVALALALCVVAAALAHTLLNQSDNSHVGRNYTAINSGQQP